MHFIRHCCDISYSEASNTLTMCFIRSTKKPRLRVRTEGNVTYGFDHKSGMLHVVHVVNARFFTDFTDLMERLDEFTHLTEKELNQIAMCIVNDTYPDQSTVNYEQDEMH